MEGEKTKINQSKPVNKVVVKVKKVKFSDNVVSITKLQLFHHLYDSYNSILPKESSFSLHSAIICLGINFDS